MRERRVTARCRRKQTTVSFLFLDISFLAVSGVTESLELAAVYGPTPSCANPRHTTLGLSFSPRQSHRISSHQPSHCFLLALPPRLATRAGLLLRLRARERPAEVIPGGACRVCGGYVQRMDTRYPANTLLASSAQACLPGPTCCSPAPPWPMYRAWVRSLGRSRRG